MYPGGLKAIRARLKRLKERRRVIDPEFEYEDSCRIEARRWLAARYPTLQWGATLTLRRRLPNFGLPMDKYIAEQVANEFTRHLNDCIFGRSARRYGKALHYLIALEHGKETGRLHLHYGIAGIPERANSIWFCNAVGMAASKNPWIYRRIDCNPNLTLDNRALNYLTKTLRRNEVDGLLLDTIPTSS